jgi:tetratricopeptide (TPR) repeat protein
MKKTKESDTPKNLETGWKKLKKGDFANAEKLFSEVWQSDSENLEALKGYAGATLRNQKYNKAKELINEYIGIRPQQYEGYHMRALCTGAEEEYEEALKDMDKALEMAEDKVELYCDMGGTYLVLQEYNRAAQCFEQAVNIDGKCFEAWMGKSLVAYFNKEYKAALEFSTITLKLNPKSLMALLIKSDVLLETGKKKEVEKEVKKILNISPDIFKDTGYQESEEEKDDDYMRDEDANRTEDDEIEEFNFDD